MFTIGVISLVIGIIFYIISVVNLSGDIRECLDTSTTKESMRYKLGLFKTPIILIIVLSVMLGVAITLFIFNI